METLFAIGVLALSVGAPLPESSACSCTEAAFGEHIEHADLVFIGTGASSVGVGGIHHWDFADAVFVKGGEQSGASSVQISTPGGSDACGYDFEVGSEYVVFAAMHEGEMRTGLCSGNMPTSELTGSQIQTLSELQVSGVDFGDDGGTTEGAGDSAGEHACDWSELGPDGCVPPGLTAAVAFLAAAGVAGFAIIKKKKVTEGFYPTRTMSILTAGLLHMWAGVRSPSPMIPGWGMITPSSDMAGLLAPVPSSSDEIPMASWHGGTRSAKSSVFISVLASYAFAYTVFSW